MAAIPGLHDAAAATAQTGNQNAGNFAFAIGHVQHETMNRVGTYYNLVRNRGTRLHRVTTTAYHTRAIGSTVLTDGTMWQWKLHTFQNQSWFGVSDDIDITGSAGPGFTTNSLGKTTGTTDTYKNSVATTYGVSTYAAGDTMDFYYHSDTIWIGRNGTWDGVPGVSGGISVNAVDLYVCMSHYFDKDDAELLGGIYNPFTISVPAGGHSLDSIAVADQPTDISGKRQGLGLVGQPTYDPATGMFDLSGNNEWVAFGESGAMTPLGADFRMKIKAKPEAALGVWILFSGPLSATSYSFLDIWINGSNYEIYSSSNGTTWDVASALTIPHGLVNGVETEIEIIRVNGRLQIKEDGVLKGEIALAGLIGNFATVDPAGLGSKISSGDWNGKIGLISYEIGNARLSVNDMIAKAGDVTFQTEHRSGVHGEDITLSNGDLTATGASGTWQNILITGLPSNETGKYYCELEYTTASGGSTVAGLAATFTGPWTYISGSDAPGDCAMTLINGAMRSSFATSEGSHSGGGGGAGTRFNFAYDAGAEELWIGEAGTYDGGGDPGAGTGATISGVKARMIMVSLYSTDAITLNAKTADFVDSVPSGFGEFPNYTFPEESFDPADMAALVAVQSGSIASKISYHAHTGDGSASRDTYATLFDATEGLLAVSKHLETATSWAVSNAVRGSTNLTFYNATNAETSTPLAHVSYIPTGLEVGSDSHANEATRQYIQILRHAPLIGTISVETGETVSVYGYADLGYWYCIVDRAYGTADSTITLDLSALGIGDGSGAGLVRAKRLTGSAYEWCLWHPDLTSGSFFYQTASAEYAPAWANTVFGNNTITVDPTADCVITLGSENLLGGVTGTVLVEGFWPSSQLWVGVVTTDGSGHALVDTGLKNIREWVFKQRNGSGTWHSNLSRTGMNAYETAYVKLESTAALTSDNQTKQWDGFVALRSYTASTDYIGYAIGEAA